VGGLFCGGSTPAAFSIDPQKLNDLLAQPGNTALTLLLSKVTNLDDLKALQVLILMLISSPEALLALEYRQQVHDNDSRQSGPFAIMTGKRWAGPGCCTFCVVIFFRSLMAKRGKFRRGSKFFHRRDVLGSASHHIGSSYVKWPTLSCVVAMALPKLIRGVGGIYNVDLESRALW
jgi:hypothetical protein